jgi:hypothetical protein
MDTMIFGTGAVLISPDEPDFIRHVPIEELSELVRTQ